jgi:lactobin A/cerein 7B family class IIb bacteriocin
MHLNRDTAIMHELTAAELDMVSGGAGTAASAAGTNQASSASGAGLGVAVVPPFIFVGQVSSPPSNVFGPANLGSTAQGS